MFYLYNEWVISVHPRRIFISDFIKRSVKLRYLWTFTPHTKWYMEQSWNVFIVVNVTRLLSRRYNCQWRFNSPPPSVAYMGRWTGSVFVQVMACRLFGAKPLPEPVLTYCQLYPKNKFPWNSNICMKENAFEKVGCKMAVILARERWIDFHMVSLSSFTLIH